MTLIVVLFVTAVGLFLLGGGPKKVEAAQDKQQNSAISVSKEGKEIADIKTAAAVSGSLNQIIKTTGLVLFPQDSTVKISPRVQGRVRLVLVKTGDTVHVGDTLAVLESADAAAALNAVRQADTRVELTRNNLERQQKLYQLGTSDVTQAESNLDQAKARTLYSKDVLTRANEQAKIGGFTDKPLEDAENAMIQAKAALAQSIQDLSLAQKDRDRAERLTGIGVGARRDFEVAENALEKTKATVQANRDSLRLAEQAFARETKAHKTNLYADQALRSAYSDYEQARLQESAAERALHLAKVSIQQNLDQAQSDYRQACSDATNAHRNLELLGHPDPDGSLKIISPISGVVSERDVNPGQVVDQSQMTPWQMFVISDNSRIWVEADVFEADLSSIHLGMPMNIVVGAYPNRQFEGHVVHIAPTLDQKTRAVKVRAEVVNTGGSLKEGMYAEVSFIAARSSSKVLLPSSAVVHDGDQDFVFAEDQGKYKKTTVKLGAQRGDQVEVLTGIHAGDSIVVHGSLFLSNQGND